MVSACGRAPPGETQKFNLKCVNLATSNNFKLVLLCFYLNLTRSRKMKPIRSNELLYLEKVINDKFRAKSKDVETEISQQAQKLADKAEKHFAKELKVEAKLKAVSEAYKKYATFTETKERMERELLASVNHKCEEVAEHLKKYNDPRDWDLSFDGHNVQDENPVDYFERKMREACYIEAKAKARSDHKLFHVLEAKQEYAKNILYSGADIHNVNVELKQAFQEADIGFQLPNSLMQITA